MWSLCRWVSSRAEMLAAPTPTAAARINTPRPQSTRNVCAAGSHQRGGSGAVRVEHGTARAEQGDLDHESYLPRAVTWNALYREESMSLTVA